MMHWLFFSILLFSLLKHLLADISCHLHLRSNSFLFYLLLSAHPLTLEGYPSLS